MGKLMKDYTPIALIAILLGFIVAVVREARPILEVIQYELK